jgi:biotin synthase-related radical SAM superfamily protein
MKYANMAKYREGQFRRITGVRRSTFEKMLEILRIAETIRRAKGGPKPKLTLEEMLLATLEYLREYRTYAHIAAGYGVSESQMFRIVKWVEDTLIKDGTFALPGRRPC